jgi:hypothetical protein
MRRGYDKQPTSEVMAQIDFVPPDVKTYKIIQARGNSSGERMVREILDRETESAKKKRSSEISRANYDFVLLRRQNFGVVPEYVLGIFPKRKDKYLLRGRIWVDASTFRIRRIEGVPARSPSFWLNLGGHLKSGHRGAQGHSCNPAICATGRYVVTRYLRRHRDSPILGPVHTCWPQYPILRVHIYWSEIAPCAIASG